MIYIGLRLTSKPYNFVMACRPWMVGNAGIHGLSLFSVAIITVLRDFCESLMSCLMFLKVISSYRLFVA